MTYFSYQKRPIGKEIDRLSKHIRRLKYCQSDYENPEIQDRHKTQTAGIFYRFCFAAVQENIGPKIFSSATEGHQLH